MSRTAEIRRETRETSIELRLVLDGAGKCAVATGIPFFDHMLTLFGHHGCFDLDVRAKGDIEVDFHHTVEDCGIVLGEAVLSALGDKSGIRRYGSAHIPMDEALARAVVDFSGRPFLRYVAPPDAPPAGPLPFQLVEEFLRAFAVHSRANLHVDILAGRDSHHMAEAVFKALARAVREAVSADPRVAGIPSTKGSL